MESAPYLGTPEEELAYLRAEVAKKEQELALAREHTGPATAELVRHELASEALATHHAAPAENLLAPEYRISPETAAAEADAILAELDLGDTERAVIALRQAAAEKGIKNALAVAERMNDPRVMDDFHRYLVRYVADGLPAEPGSASAKDEKSPRMKALRMTLYEVALPEPGEEGEAKRERPFKELVSAMEQLYAGLLAVGAADAAEPGSFALELAVPADAPELKFYAAIPNGKRDLFEKQLLAVFPDARLLALPYDYNLFAKGIAVASVAKLATYPALPVKEYDEFDYDPLNAITNAFAKIASTGEGAGLQLVIEPAGERYVKHYKKMLDALRKGVKHGEALSLPETELGRFAREAVHTLFSRKGKDEDKRKEAEAREIEANKTYIEQVERKIASPVAAVSLRLVASAGDGARASQILAELEAAFNQFGNTGGNRFEFSRVPATRLASFSEEFSFRLPASAPLPLSLRELTTLFHFPPAGLSSSPHLAQARFAHAPAPLTLPAAGALLGTNTYRGQATAIRLAPEDRLRHLYIIGQTGTGKTGLMKSLIIEDIKAGEGCCFIDPHGSDIVDILAAIPPERYEDVIYFDPADLARPFGLNFLEYDASRPEQKTFIVNELLAIFKRLYGDVPESMGPAFEQYFRNATLLVMEDPATGSTILDIARVLANAEFREAKLARCMNPVVAQFWREIATKAGGEAALENIVPYITNKFDDFTANDFIRPIVGQQHSSFTFREVMDSKKILLVNLSKGRLGERNANLLGLIIVGKLFMAALSRADNPRAAYPPFYLYIDEFQNVTTDSIPGILSEARKYKLALTVAHQFLAQIEEKTRDAVFGNVGNMAVFRVGEEDAEQFAKIYAPVFSALDFVNIENRNAYVKILAAGVPQKPLDLRTPDLPALRHDQVEDLIQLSALTYGRDRASVETMIRERYLAR
ncbi:MAG: TraM recognition domain-containing protein [Patescibacteria group bacterium]|nr:TraM recognition domain-containing protein [Patescibacteria group bacterium]MDE1944173.1 TraM recognition domain-containing protein [Patescibacteria group bacterium]MDE1945075.1 TraM recognition domain-containing protein [Patescibacteria group bacterium]MDE2057839.1 TraM recognition domain-containing protein [Patescibacteria group bacterium]